MLLEVDWVVSSTVLVGPSVCGMVVALVELTVDLTEASFEVVDDVFVTKDVDFAVSDVVAALVLFDAVELAVSFAVKGLGVPLENVGFVDPFRRGVDVA